MGLRTSVTGCIAMLGVVAAASGCSGRVPGQATALDLRGMTPTLARAALASGDPRATAALKALASLPAADRPALEAVKAQALTAATPGGPAIAAPPAAPPRPLEAPAAPPTLPAAPVAAAPPPDAVMSQPAAALAAPPTDLFGALKPDQEPAETGSPVLGFVIPAIADLAAAIAPDPSPVLFRDSFEAGLADWVSRGLGLPAASQDAEDDAVVLATTKARRSLWIKTRGEIDLARSTEPRLRLEFKGAPVALKAVWETDNGDFPEEILLMPAEAADADAPPEFDLAALKGRPGRLVLVARTPRGADAAPVLDAVTIYDAAVAQRGVTEVASR